jgi:predicted nucleic acid-binding protein
VPTNADATPDVLVDTSVAVALAIADHAAHGATLTALHGRTLGLAGHAWFETYSVLTRLPPPNRREPRDVARLLAHDFPGSRFLDVRTQQRLTMDLAALGIAGGSLYDALVGAVAAHHGLLLVTRDRRALGTYERLNADVELLD